MMTGQERILIVLHKQNLREFTPKVAPIPKTYNDLQASYKSKNLQTLYKSNVNCWHNSYRICQFITTKSIELCTHEDNKPQLPTVLLPLANQYEHLDKDTQFNYILD